MSPSQRDYSVFDKFEFERKPVGVKFVPVRPEGVQRLSKALNFCEMIGEAQNNAPFYVQREDFHCIEPLLLGMEDPPPVYISGLFGASENLFKEARACRKMYEFLPRMLKGSVQFVAFGAVDQISFDPDVLILTATLSQSQTLLRSIGYSTGEMYTSKCTPVAACAWIYIYPVLSGEMNYTVSGLGLGMRAVKALPEGLFIISVPWVKLSTMMENLQEIYVGPKPPPPGGDLHRERVAVKLEELQKQMAQ